jgi:hypothetical protein
MSRTPWHRLRTCPWLIGELGQRRSPPPAEAVAEHRGCPLIITVGGRLTGGGERHLEAPGVDGVTVRGEHVAGRAADDPATGRVAVVEYVAQPRDIGLQRRLSSGRRIITPHRLDQPVDRDNRIGMDDQDREESAEPGVAGGDSRAVVVDLDRTQQPTLHRNPLAGRTPRQYARSLAVR